MTRSVPSTMNKSDQIFAGAVLGVAGTVALVWSDAASSAWVCGHRVPRFRLAAIAALPHNWRDPSLAWASPVGPAWLYWTLLVLEIALLVSGALLLHSKVRGGGSGRSARTTDAGGTATRAEVRRSAGERTLLSRARTLRPGAVDPTSKDLGHLLGRSRGVQCWASAEDSIVVLGPPRSGKGLHLVIPFILDAPGAVITTSTRPDNLTATLRARETRGDVAVFDPQRLAPGVANLVRWSPMRGCVDPQTAMIRARALCSGVAANTTESTFWQASTEQAVRCLLHAGALSDATAEDLYRWSLSPMMASEALGPLTDDPRATQGWAHALTSILGADQKQRDSIWAMVAIALSALADPHVLDAVSPRDGEKFDPVDFLRSDGTLYLLGTSSGASSTTGLVTAFIEDVVEVARRLAAGSAGARLDPPLTLVLDEAANYRMPSLTSLMSEGGGTGISTVVVLQSLAQARAVWGDHEGAALWDSAIVKIVLGGGSNARDLDDLSRLIGTREERDATESIGPDGRRSYSLHRRDVPILEPGELRQLPFGQSVLLLRSARPILLDLKRWIDRPDAPELIAAQRELESAIRDGHSNATA
jgi:type IV secretion system protein VirD4